MPKLIFIPVMPDKPITEIERKKEPSLEEIRKHGEMGSDAFLELVRIKYGQGLAWMFVDEDGRFKRLPRNDRATQWTGMQHLIVGNAVVWTGDMS